MTAKLQNKPYITNIYQLRHRMIEFSLIIFKLTSFFTPVKA